MKSKLTKAYLRGVSDGLLSHPGDGYDVINPYRRARQRTEWQAGYISGRSSIKIIVEKLVEQLLMLLDTKENDDDDAIGERNMDQS